MLPPHYRSDATINAPRAKHVEKAVRARRCAYATEVVHYLGATRKAMSNVGLIIPERARQVGNFLVGRLLPFHSKRSVGPFVFIDHMGPVAMNDHENVDIGPHPHIGLSTLTYLFEGSIMHRDSLGTAMEIAPGAVNWMTAGSGIVHSERTPDHLRHVEKHLHGLQIWVALPKEHEETAPSFHHVEAHALPQWEQAGTHYKLIAGELLGHRSPVPVFSKLYLVEIASATDHEVRFSDSLYGEAGLYILEGMVHTEEASFGPRQLLVAKDAARCGFRMAAGTRVYLFGGEPLPEERLIFWNFVATDQTKIDRAKQRWQAGQFPMPPGEANPIPLPTGNRT